ALVISGGGSKGAFAVGAIAALRARGITWDGGIGSSTGALIAPLVAIDAIDQLVQVYRMVTTDAILDKRGPLALLSHASVYDTDPLWRLITQQLTEAVYAQVVASPMDCLLVTINMQAGTETVWCQHGAQPTPWLTFVRALLASATQPLLMPVVPIRDEE